MDIVLAVESIQPTLFVRYEKPKEERNVKSGRDKEKKSQMTNYSNEVWLQSFMISSR